MSFIAIAIFTVYTTHTVYVGRCADVPPPPGMQSYSICADYMAAVPQETGRSEPVYAGEFPSVEACQKAADAVKYAPTKGERVGDVVQVLCVPKERGSGMTK